MKTLTCVLLVCLSVCVYCQSRAALSQQAAEIIRRLMAARQASKGTQTAPVAGLKPSFPGRFMPPGFGSRPQSYSPPMGNFWQTAMMARMLGEDGLMFE